MSDTASQKIAGYNEGFDDGYNDGYQKARDEWRGRHPVKVEDFDINNCALDHALHNAEFRTKYLEEESSTEQILDDAKLFQKFLRGDPEPPVAVDGEIG